MCGRYALDENGRALAAQFGLQPLPEITPRYNIAPGTPVLAIRQDVTGRRGEWMLWGLVPSWTRSAPQDRHVPQPFNARSETVARRPMFRSAFSSRRCILPASGFYEWQQAKGGSKQPWFIRPPGVGTFAMAGIFELSQADAPATCCILTTGANARVAEVHDRMPVLLDPAAVRDWLDPRTPRDVLESLLVPAPLEATIAYPVSARVNRADHDDLALTRPIGVTPETHEPRETDA